MGVSADFFFLFTMHKNGVFGADFEVINTRFYHWGVICLTLHIYTYRFSFYFQNYSVLWNTIVVFIPSSGAPPPGKLWEKLHQNGVFWAHFEVLINLNGHFYNWKFIRKKCFSLYIDYMYTCISIFFFRKYSYTLAFEYDRKHHLSVYFLLNVF